MAVSFFCRIFAYPTTNIMNLMIRRQLTSTLLIVLLFILAGCQSEKRHYVIGVSQCSQDIWRDKQNAELKMGAYFHDNVELKFAAAFDSDERQVQQIDSLVATGIDLLIVAPNQVSTISPAIDRAYDKGIPVIVFERKTSSRKYTAFISADNYEMGRVMGEYIVSRLGGKGNVLEIKGLEGSSPAIERHNGFMDAIKEFPGIKVVGSLQGDWTEQTAYETTKRWLSQQQKEFATPHSVPLGQRNSQQPIDLVFGANDRTAMGARKALLESQQPKANSQKPHFCGIDGLPGENGGIQLVRESLLDASYIYPTHGDQIIDLAVRILEGKPYAKETMMMSALVTRDNAKVLLMESEEIMRQAARLDQLHQTADSYLHELDTQRMVNWLALGIIALLVIVFVLFYLYHLKKIAIQREHVVNTLWNMDVETQPAPIATPHSDQRSENTEHPIPNTEHQTPPPSEGLGEALFITRFKEVVEKRLADSDISVEDLAADMNLSRVQLYRKVKNLTGSSPVELLRTARLNRAYQLLLTSDKSVSEVAYDVGFTAPSYFTKCFKEEFGMLPGDVRQN